MNIDLNTTFVIAALIVAASIAFWLVTHNAKASSQQVGAALLHRAAVDSVAMWKAAVAAELADAAASTQKAQANAAQLAAFISGQQGA